MENKSVLLLGGTGTLSTAVLRQALLKGYKITIMNRGSNNKNVPDGVEVVIGDFKNADNMRSKFAKATFDVVVDFLSRVPDDIERVFPIFKDRCQQYIFISSACVYRRAKCDFPIKESSPKPNKDWSYNTEKYESELKLQELAKDAKSYYTIIRPYITYNEERIPLGIAPSYRYHRTIIDRIKAGKPWFVWDDGKAITTVTYTADFAVGVVGLFLNDKAKNEDFHITSDYSYTQKEVVEMLFMKLNVSCNIVSIPTSKLSATLPEYKSMLIGDRALDAKFDNTKIKSAVPELHFKTSLSEGLDIIIKHWKESKPQYDYQFEAQIDKMLYKNNVKARYIEYQGESSKAWFIYHLYKFFPTKIANRIKRIIHI